MTREEKIKFIIAGYKEVDGEDMPHWVVSQLNDDDLDGNVKYLTMMLDKEIEK